ncbi:MULTISPECIES: SpoIIE family protein phosphatase [unclassified Streptomyces]|uniref:SpoIIE family protein phosphatase n=1 Tax=unclassified Streptomyces TaxID=2593676 RepID=UPI002DD9048E|nr:MULTISPECIES: SpoIIE family protein phosphatase [unclassified Streptomyces]WSF82467.1 SpoIIE family protein phosphatase [Streptomyces sp. NBC_01744]WSC41237.1 SpoIIE family protein phosphatase [Streptomyces sp. NBC_01763]WSC49627.1 SpoIIE family protein phosphatase [Streptomyces sp. NBC_01762]WSC51617.1 SpoIIE family protein phosphatase [Streptomyces sp. NBC_01761]WSD29207.1 SpoIIE family protein phosphatase [Streptomyces sp. NBC_01751]
MTDNDRTPDADDSPRVQLDRRHNGETGTAQRLALNRTGSFEWDLDARTLDIDVAGLLVFGVDPDTFTPRPGALLERLEPVERTRLELAADEAINGSRSSYSIHFQVPLDDGTHQWTHIQARVLRSDDGRAHRVIGVVRDATAEITHSAFVLDLEKRRQRQTSIVERTTSAMARAVTVDDVTAALTGPGGLARLGADGLALALVENNVLNVIALSGDAPEAISEVAAKNLDPRFPLADTILRGRPRFATSVGALTRRYPALEPYVDQLKFRAAAYLPLVAQARTLGGLALFYHERTAFNADERNLCLGLAAIVSQSLQRATLFDEEREFATGLQSAMLPRQIQEIKGGEIAVRYHAAWSGRQVGGDWYDVIPLPKNRFGIVVGDVEGHDTHAAAIMGQLRIALRAYAAEGHPPATVLARASRFLDELDTDRFATCTYAQVDLASGTVRMVRAGHFGPLIRHTDGRIGLPQVRGGLPLGISTAFEDEEFPETRLDLVPGETLVLYTDGLVEEPGADIDAGVRALVHEVRAGPTHAQPLADHLSDRLWERWGAGDDVALLVLRRSPDPGSPRAPRLHQYIHQADPEGLSEARAMVRQALDDWNLAEFADDAELITGELLVNVLLHTDGGAVLTLEVLPKPVRRVRLSVQDRSSAWPRRRTPGETATSGRGLLLLDAIAIRWGVESRGEGKAVWCEIGPSAPSASAARIRKPTRSAEPAAPVKPPGPAESADPSEGPS